MYNPFKNFSDSLKNTEGGYSGRKLTAFTLTACIVALHVFYFIYALVFRDFTLFTTVLIIDLVGVAFFLGLVTIANIIELKNGKVTSTKETIITETIVEKDKPDVQGEI